MDDQVSLSSTIERPFVLQENGITFTGELTFEQWLECGDILKSVEKGIHWWIGDWLNYGGKQPWGKMYDKATKQTGFVYDTARHDQYVASRIEFGRRRPNLSHSHHAEVAQYEPEEQDMLLDQAIEKKWTRDQLRREKTKFLNSIVPSDPIAIEKVHDPRIPLIHQCDIADLHMAIEKDSVDAIITDPPYPRDFLGVYNDLADFAIHALKDGGSLIAMVGQSYLPEILDMLRKEPLHYHWLACYYIPGYTTKQWQRNIGISWKPLLWFVKGEYTGPWRKDVVREDIIFIGEKKDKQHHEWGQPEHDMANIIEHFTQPGHLICDPFVGGGTTAVASLDRDRRFVGCDINEQYVTKTQQRMKDFLAIRKEEAS